MWGTTRIHLRTTAFLLYINDIKNCSKLFHFIIFADDTNLTYSHSNLNQLIEIVNRELRHLSDWFCCNKLSLNAKKTNYIMFGNKKIPPSDSICITFNGTIINRVTSIKFLGVFVDEHLDWKKHISHVSSKISRSIGIMNRLRYVLPKSTLLTLYYSLIQPNLLYCVIV